MTTYIPQPIDTSHVTLSSDQPCGVNRATTGNDQEANFGLVLTNIQMMYLGAFLRLLGSSLCLTVGQGQFCWRAHP
jgi:hypothetical protein